MPLPIYSVLSVTTAILPSVKNSASAVFTGKHRAILSPIPKTALKKPMNSSPISAITRNPLNFSINASIFWETSITMISVTAMPSKNTFPSPNMRMSKRYSVISEHFPICSTTLPKINMLHGCATDCTVPNAKTMMPFTV